MAFIFFSGRVECIIYHSMSNLVVTKLLQYIVWIMMPVYAHQDLVMVHLFDYDHDHVNIRGTENRIACISLEVEVCSGLLGRIRGRIYS